MSSLLFYFKLAKENIFRNKQVVAPFICACIVAVAFFFNLCNLQAMVSLQKKAVYASKHLATMLNIGVVIVAIITVIFVIYANSFLIKNRKKELGLYGILGLEKRHINLIMFFEILIIATISVFFGIFFGSILGGGTFKILEILIKGSVGLKYKFLINPAITTIIFFGLLFFVLLILNTISVHLTEPIELLKSKAQGEKKIRFLKTLAFLGFLLLSLGYYIALNANIDYGGFIILLFLIATVLVIIATHLLFLFGTTFVLKTLKKNKSFYYRVQNFISISTLIYRIRKNAAGLANICILSCMVLSAISMTAAIYNSYNEQLEIDYPKDYKISWDYRIGYVNPLEKYSDILKRLEKKYNVKIKDAESLKQGVLQVNNKNSKGNFKNSNSEDANIVISILTKSLYEKLGGKPFDYTGKNALLLSINQPKTKEIIVGNTKYAVKSGVTKELLKEMPYRLYPEAEKEKNFLIVVDKDKSIENFFKNLEKTSKNYKQKLYFKIKNYYLFNLEGSRENIEKFENAINNRKSSLDSEKHQEQAQEEKMLLDHTKIKEAYKKDMFYVIGGLYFVGILLSILFTVVTLLIICFKQISEGFEDRDRFLILQNIGLSEKEAKQAINKQLSMMFFMPLVVSLVHTGVANVLLNSMIAMFMGYETGIYSSWYYAGVTSAIFSIFYVIVYLYTSKKYYKMVYEKESVVC